MKKSDFFSKITVKNYNNVLEEILEKKKFPSNAKNLLLSIFYKVELGYTDYKTIKRLEITIGQFLEEIIETIRDKCEKIELVEPNSKKGQVLTKHGLTSISDSNSKTIISFPIEKELLYAIYNLRDDDFRIKKKYPLISTTLSNILRIGSNIEIKEVIRDFNGWSWDIDKNNIENFECNLIYQNIRILLGSTFLFLWKNETQNDKDYISKMKSSLVNIYGKESAKEFFELLLFLSIILSINNDEDIKNDILNDKKDINFRLELMLDKTKFLDKITEEKKNINKELKRIDKIINSKDTLQKELKKICKEQNNTISDIETLKKALLGKRKELVSKLNNYTKMMNPKKYVKTLNQLQEKAKILQKIDINMISDDWIYENIIELQKAFLYCLGEKIGRIKDKSQIIEMIYHLRYYKKIPLNEEISVEEVKELKNIIDNLEEMVIVKGIELKAFNIMTKNEYYAIELIKMAINSNIINLENIDLEINIQNENLQVHVYDGEVLDNVFELAMNTERKDINLKTNKKIKLFVMKGL